MKVIHDSNLLRVGIVSHDTEVVSHDPKVVLQSD